jgi:ribosome maturation protein SDO1
MGIGKTPLTFQGKHKVTFNLAKLKKAGQVFEVVVDPDLAIAHKKGEKIPLHEVLKGEHIFADAQKGLLASENSIKEIFGTTDENKVAEIILQEGEIQLTTEHRERLREDKRKKILAIIHRNALDPQTKLPHPLARLESALEETKFKIDEFKTAEEQVDDVVKKIQVILPIRIERVVLQIHVPPKQAHQSYGLLKRMGEIKKEAWGNDGSIVVHLDIPAGLQEDVMDSMNALTHGGVEIHIVKELPK